MVADKAGEKDLFVITRAVAWGRMAVGSLPGRRIAGKVDNRISETGSVVVEFALILPVFAFLFLGVVDFGFGVRQAMIVSEAAHVGTRYSSLPARSTDLQGMQNAAVISAAGLSPFKATATNWCSCTANGAHVNCTDANACGGAASIEYAQVSTSASMPVLLGYPGLPVSFPLSGFSAVRVR